MREYLEEGFYMKIKAYHLVILLVSVILGVMAAMQFKSSSEIIDANIERTEKMAEKVEAKKKEIEELKIKVDEMNLQLQEAAESPEMYALNQQLITYGILAGTVEVKGPGVKVLLSDSEEPLKPGQDPSFYVLHDVDILKVLNELKAAGAEAIAINDERVIATTDIRCGGPVIIVNKNKRLAAPFVIKAIGHPDTLYNSLMMKGGVVEQLKFWNIRVSVQKADEVIIPNYTRSIKLEARLGGSISG